MSKCTLEPRINYHRSLLLTEVDHVKKLEALAAKEEATAEREALLRQRGKKRYEAVVKKGEGTC